MIPTLGKETFSLLSVGLRYFIQCSKIADEVLFLGQIVRQTPVFRAYKYPFKFFCFSVRGTHLSNRGAGERR